MDTIYQTSFASFSSVSVTVVMVRVTRISFFQHFRRRTVRKSGSQRFYADRKRLRPVRQTDMRRRPSHAQAEHRALRSQGWPKSRRHQCE